MSKEKQISLAVTTYNRFEFTIECFKDLLDDERVSEIIISDDKSNDGSFEKLKDYYKEYRKVYVYQNDANMGVYNNKRIAIATCTNKWAIIGDSDNIFLKSYVDTLFALPDWKENVAYCPDMAQIALDYRHFGGILITKHNAGEYIDQRNGGSLFNTMNGFYNVFFYLKVFEKDIEPIAADSIQQNLNYLLNDGAMYIVEGLNYFHRIHPGSHYVNFTHKSDVYHKQITDKIRLMK